MHSRIVSLCLLPSWILLLLLLLLLSQGGCASDLPEGSGGVHLGRDADECPEGKYFSSQHCLECHPGHYCPGNVSAPHRCPAGTFNLYAGKSSISDCKPCFPGLISSEDRADCRPCPAGFSCDPANGDLSLCPPGQHSPEGLLKCLTCPADSACMSGFPVKCGPGKQPSPDHAACTDCLPGFYSTACTIQCLQCPAGSYCPNGGMAQPRLCPPGSSSTAGQTSCRHCEDSLCGGTVAPRLSLPAHRASQTAACRAGTYKDATREACVVCPVGHYCAGGVALPCPAGTYGPVEGLQRLRDCTMCPAGFYCLEGSVQTPTSEFLCPLGHYCEEGTATPHGSPCPAGTAGEQLGQTSRAACKRCREGRFCPAGSSGPGLPCARGRFCPAGLEEVLCPRGTFTPHQGAISVKDCLKCPPGFYCPEDVSDPVPCPSGTFNPLEGQDELADCRECYAGKACTQVALRRPDVDCMPGFVCPPGSSKPNAPNNACPPGTLSNRTDLTDRSQCQQCPARYACLRGTGGIQRPPLSCFAGHYCPPGTMFPTQYKCPVGTWSGNTGLETERECRPCPQGWYCLAGSGAPSGRCNSGHFCPEGTAYGTQFPCPAGTYSLHLGNKQGGDCLLCPEGSFCQRGTSKPSACPPSTFRQQKGGRRLEDCSACPAGYFCPNPATVNPRVCGAGSYSDEGSLECSPCLRGHYCSNETTSEEAMLSVMVCPPGFLCSQGLARDPQRSATLCPRGFYCPGGGIDPNPVPCPNGTYSEFPGLRDAAECVQCPEGKYCYSQQPQLQPITAPTGACPHGHYCPRGTGHPHTFPCQAGLYRNSTLGHSGEACVLCPARHYCERLGTHTPSTCPQGHYCPEGTSAPAPCPQGTYSSRFALSEVSECSPCGGGLYCSGVGLSEPSGSCQESYYCKGAAKSGTPADGPTGGLCPAGSYCPLASSSPLPCPPGTFGNSTGLSRIQDCISCPPGFYCLGFNNTAPSGLCLAGFFCTGGSDSPAQHEAQEGHYTWEGAAGAQRCPLGTYQPHRGQRSCVECQGGRLCNQTGSSQSSPCPSGHYCPPGSAAALACPPGSYSDQPGGGAAEHCRPCEAGHYCGRAGLSHPQGLCDPGHYCTSGASTASPVAAASGGVCPAGYVCPRGTAFPEQFPCPAGTWSSLAGAQNGSWCRPCPAGFYCDSAGLSRPSGICRGGYYCSGRAASPSPSDGLTGNICPVEHYCPSGSASPLVCPDGTYSNTTGSEVCKDCPVGTYCLSGEGVQLCPAGHYCLGGGVEGILPCPPGTYSPQFGLSQVEQCLICPAGFFCEEWGLFEPSGPCQAGYYCIAGVNFPNPDGNFSTGVGGACPQGSYCPEGTGLPLSCPRGSYSDGLHLTDVFGCSPCPPGHYCGDVALTRPSGLCQAGFYCPGGDSAATGSLGAVCPVAHYCPEGSLGPVPCPAGTYANLTGRSSCSRCPSGYYCAEKTDDFTRFPCPPGFYCPDGTRHATQFPCPRGYYNPEPMTQSLDSCLPCPPGHYCEKERLTKVSGKCKAGWFCVSAAWNSQPFDLDNYTNANCLCPATSTGGRCQVGYYCPSGSHEPLACPPGAFCNISGLALPTGPCSPGYYCTGGATAARPTDGETGGVCPAGTYCVEGSSEPELCPTGTFSPLPGVTGVAGCQPCPAGSYCEEAGLTAPTGPCTQGYWCPPAQAAPTAFPCPPGHFCSQGSAAPDRCPPGFYQDREKQATCAVCEEGHYCDSRTSNISQPRPCLKGHYCPAGTAWPEQHPCPRGTFNPRERARSLADCVRCAAGQYCPSVGLSEPAGPCLAGYWCKEGASSPSPLDGLSGLLCPPGQYCPSGATAPLACPEGSWSNSSGLRAEDECKACPEGYYCAAAGITGASGVCSGGYYCTRGAVTPTPTQGSTGGPCPEGSYCPEGSVQPVLCQPGTYTAASHATRCERCPPGWYCVSGSLLLCPAGFYCPEGSGLDLRSCPEGTYGPDQGFSSVSQCRQCDRGHYCSSRNGTAATGQCLEGYYCSWGNASPRPSPMTGAGQGGPCPAGHYCPRASVSPRPCPRGTYSNLSKLVSQGDCQPCSPGYYCDAAGLSAPSGKCADGFYCLEGADRPDPSFGDGRGGPCPRGHYCPGGSAAPRHCPRGTISREEGQSSCSACPQGFYCPSSHNGSLAASFECPAGHYCPPGTWSQHQYPCPPGSINPHTAMAKPQDCLPCPPGFFCAAAGGAAVSGQCEAGYYCLSGARSATPQDAGATGDGCPKGHYCPRGSSTPLPCPAGHYGNESRSSRLSDCLPCPAGLLCVTRGLSFPSQRCPAGSYCPGVGNGSSLQASVLCPAGNMCPPGSERQVPCSPGTYQDSPGQAECAECPAGYYCAGSVGSDNVSVSGAHSPVLCPRGHYCPPGTQSAAAFPCPAGAFSRQMGLSNQLACERCPPGRYCGSSGLASPSGFCSPGYICVLGAASAQPVEGPTGGPCSAGFYCPEGTINMVPCPAGTFGSVDGAVSAEACRPCSPGYYCAEVGLSSPSGPCKPGFYCTGGSRTASPLGNLTAGSSFPEDQFNGGECPAGHYCPLGSAVPRPCPPGTFSGRSSAESEAECEACHPGSYCPSWAQTSVSLLCPPGWFCPAGSASGHQTGFRCPPGHACPLGSAEPTICGSGTFQSLSGQPACDSCPPGFYCAEGSPAPTACPAGSVNPSAHGTSLADCSACASGFFCNGSGQPEPSGPCSAGYFCSSGSSEASPVAKTHGDVCPAGHFCPRGSGSPTPCPAGSFLPEPGASSPSQCLPCPPGSYCSAPGSSQPTGLCSGGFFSPGGAHSPTPRAGPSLFTCLWEILEVYGAATAGGASRTSNLSHLASPANPANPGRDTGRIDVMAPQANSDHGVTLAPPPPLPLRSQHNVCSSYKGDMCPKGFYCRSGSAHPQLCDAGSYCDQTGLEVPAGHCAAGYYCPQGSSQATAAPCPRGHYCPLGTPLPLPCPPGTMKSWFGGSTLEACRLCPPGNYCEQAGMAEPSGPCAEGYYCPEGQRSQRPDGHVCSAGHYCEKGSVGEAACPPGSFQLQRGQGSCQTCPAGSYCQDQGTTAPLRCTGGFYCPSGSANQRPCPPGTYGNVSGLVEERQCTQCDPGMYCKETGRATPSGPCAAGYVCIGGASEPSPPDGPTGFLCPSGFYCPAGNPAPEPCPKGTFSEQRGLAEERQCRRCAPGFYCSGAGLSAVSGPCLAGFYCLEGSEAAAPTQTASGDVCPAGHYCAEGSSVPTPCPAGFHRNETGGKGEGDCYRCPSGWFQESSGQTVCLPCPPGFHCQSHSPHPLLCPAGYICPDKSSDGRPLPCPQGTYSPGQGLTSAGQCLACPLGQFCASEGLTEPSGFCAAGFLCATGASVPNPTDNRTGSLCPPGTFCQRGSKAGDCLAGFYCTWGSSRADETLCPAGFFCPSGTPVPLPCPVGTFSTKAGNTHQDNCTSCNPGHYCEAEGTVLPALCPAGHYCPPGSTLGRQFPCPTGSVQSQPGASSPAACLPCPPGSYCSSPGLSQQTGQCQAGFYCPAGSTSPNATAHQGNSTGSHLCPPGHYCPVGTGQPLPCPAGSLSTSQGRRGDEECPPCPPGAFCDRPALAELSDALPCHAGYVCLGGSSVPAPSDGSHGYLCPAGHSCPVGSAREVPCEPGTYSPAPGAARCLSCPGGTVCSSSGTKQPSLCPAGHLCPAGTALPQPCPSGTFSNNTGAHNLSVCTPCPSGRYCHSVGTTIPQGTCLPGYLCRGGATDPAPQTSDDSPNNGPCPIGHYCPAGCLSPIPCPPGSIRNSTGGVTVESCSACPAGHYCSSEGLAQPSGPCAAGFYCPFDFSSTTPYAFLCPKGHYCPEGSPVALPCPTGEYQPNPGSPSCIPCRPGFYCEEAIVGEPRPCPPHSFCPAGTMVPEPCPNGTYTSPSQGGLQDERECLACPPGNFCRAGRILGSCAAGFLCLSGSADSTPQGRLSNLTQCQWGVQCAGPCPAGSFCPAGAVEAEICPANSFRGSPGGASQQDCLPCPPQHWCKAGDPVPQLCPAGHYCDGVPGEDFGGAAGPRPCPPHTYRAAAGAGSKADCLPCPPGWHCDSAGLSDYSSRPCPPGFWCSGSGPPVLCPAGTYRALPGAHGPNQCEPCPGGSFCPDPHVTGKANVEGIPCRASYQCPVGSLSEIPCRAGSYCGPRTAEPQVCPEGYICPEGSYSYQAAKQLCPFPYYCPANSSAMKSCDGGLVPVNTSGLRGSKSSCCSACEGGTYRPHLSLVLHCLPCPAGYFCPPGTEDYKSNSCPAGYSCAIGSSQPTPCRPGTFGNRSRAENADDCHPCPAGTFNHLPAQKACFPCGSSSTSQAGSASCTCSGKNRAFQHSDGSCLCRTGFIFYDKLDLKSSTADSGLDCQPEASQRCAAGQIRLAASRECVSPPLYSCNITCAPHGGSLDAEMGICQCERYVSSEELCNTSCLARLPQLLSRAAPDGLLQLSLVKGGKVIWQQAATNMLAPDHIVDGESRAYLVEFDSTGVFGWIATRADLIAQFLAEPAQLLSSGQKARRSSVDGGQRTNLSVAPRIPNPIVCLSAGDMLIFALTINHTDRRLSHFPVYQKDHLFNSNPSWDFGAFRRLQMLIKQSNFNSTRFAHVFTDTGKYVFVDSAVPDWSLVVAVSKEGTECDPRSSVFQPMTPAQLVKHGIVKQHRLHLLPDWGLIAGILSLLLVAVLVVTITVIVLRPGKAKLVSQWRLKPKWRNLGEPFCPVDCACSGDGIVSSLGGFPGTRGAGEGAECEEPAVSKGGSASRYSDLEEFNVKTLFDKLEDQNLHVASQLARHREDTQEFYRSICQQAKSLKDVFENMDGAKLSVLQELLVRNSARGTLACSRGEETDARGDGDRTEAFIELLGAVLRSVEALLCRQKSQDLRAAFPPDTRDCDQPAGSSPAADANMLFTQFSSGNVTKAEDLAPSPSDHDLSKLAAVSPLFKTLQEIKQSLQDLSVAESYQQPHRGGRTDSVQEGSDGALVPTPLENLSSQHSAVFLLGCQVMRLLADCPRFPSAVLLLARSIPAPSSLSDEAQLARCPRDFYFDTANQILYLPEAELQHVGRFIATIVQSMAHVASGCKPQGFVHALHEAISAVGLQLFKLSFRWSKEEADGSKGHLGTLAEEFLDGRVPTEAQFTDHLLASRLEGYNFFKLEQLMDEAKQDSPEDSFVCGSPPNGTPVQASFVEEEIDRMNESFLRLSVELQNRTRLSLQPGEGDGSVGNHSSAQATADSVPGPSRHGTILLEVRRRHVSQRLNELGIALGRIRGCQRRDSRPKDGTRGRAHAHVDGGRPSGGRGPDGIPASRSRSQKSVTGASLGNRDLESHISRHGEGDDLDSSGIQRTESDMNPGVSGQQEGSGRIQIENTSGHTDTDAMSVAENPQLSRRFKE